MAGLKGTNTENNLKDAFAGESQANRRYLYFAQKADVEGYNDISAVFRSTAEGKASSVQFVHFPFTPAQAAAFKAPGTEVVVGFDHAAYGHMAVMPEAVRAALAGDLE